MKKTVGGLWSMSFFAVVLAGFSAHAANRTALDDYVAKPDPNYAFKLVNTLPGEGGTAYVLEMISQQWLTEKEVDKPIWKHWVTIIKPDKVTSETALLFIAGGSNEKPAPDKIDGSFGRIASE